MRQTVTAVAVASIALLAGCGASTGSGPETSSTGSDDGSSSSAVAGDSGPEPYAGPMSLPQDFADNASVPERSGAAGRAVECDGEPYAGGGGDYDSGLESVQDTATDALTDWLDNEAWAYQVPETGYRVERDDGDRVLLSYDVDERTRIAFIAADGIRDYEDDEGWGIESWAQCDPAELPADVTETLGIGVWADGSGARVPVTRIRSFQGPEHCGWEDITFLGLGPERSSVQYVRDPSGALDDLLRTTYDPDATLPEGATDTGYQRDGRRLWLAGGPEAAAYLIGLDDPDQVERWPAAKRPIGCS